MEPYNTNKASLHYEQLIQLQNGIQPYPVHVQLIISDYCNQDCSFCAYRMSGYSSNQLFKVIDQDGNINNNPKRMIPWEKLQEIIEDCKYMKVKAIQITGGGEPTLHPKFNELCELILESGIDLAVVTNGLLLNERRAKILSNATWIRISVDAGNAKTYSLIRNVPEKEFDIVEKNVKFLSNIQNKRCCVGVGFVITKNNYIEIVDACKKFKDWNIDNVRLSAVFQNDNENFYEEIYDLILKNVKEATLIQNENFKVYNNFNSRYEDLKQRSPNYIKCGYMNFTTYIGGDQNVYTCCVNSYNSRGKIGSIADKSFKDLWDSTAKQQMFNQFDARDCSRCMFNDKNLAIEKLLHLPSGHSNFV